MKKDLIKKPVISSRIFWGMTKFQKRPLIWKETYKRDILCEKGPNTETYDFLQDCLRDDKSVQRDLSYGKIPIKQTFSVNKYLIKRLMSSSKIVWGMTKVSPKKKGNLFHENTPIKESTDNLDIRVVFKLWKGRQQTPITRKKTCKRYQLRK